ncbi:hypothetical protein CYMTET_34572 [Cymbomonas tetramitiformis]|uniref:Uncharacterized protein n=1 Tax=Cymbomonas tetramitiformis TaxID=36881 RepID=A0AAE0FAV7_9CHLO|nr:hypothetical protein CYMTET_34572 [Cymbomonas tetramitiformis]
MMQIYRASVKPDPKGRRSLRNVIRQHFELADKRLTGRCSPAETVVLEKTKAWIRARGGIVTSRNTVIDVPGVLDEPSPWNVPAERDGRTRSLDSPLACWQPPGGVGTLPTGVLPLASASGLVPGLVLDWFDFL